MIESKPWEWSKLNEEGQKKWKEPSIESYYLINRWKKQNKKDFLDIGCGLGRHTIQFAKKGFNVNSIDLSEEAIKTTKEWLDTEGIKIIIEQIYNILRKDGECFLTLGSKNAETFKNKNNPQKDENTAIRMDEGPEKRNTTLLCRYKNNTRTI